MGLVLFLFSACAHYAIDDKPLKHWTQARIKELGARLAETALLSTPLVGYRLQLGNNKITWHATIDGRDVVETREPQTTVWKRFTAWILKIAPERQL